MINESGDGRGDSHLARKLGSIVNMPEQKVNAFIRTRDKGTVYELKKVLKEMPHTHGICDDGRPLMRSASAPSCSQQSSRSSSSANRRQATQARLASMGTVSTTYGAFHGELGEEVGGSPPKSKSQSGAFKGIIKSQYKPGFEDWKENASESKVRVFADACRSLRYFNGGEKAPTTYHSVHADFPGHVSKSPPEKENLRNVSAAVPIGSIYKQSEKEALNRKAALETHAEHIACAIRRQAEWRNGRSGLGKPGEEGALSHSLRSYSELPPATIHENMKTVPRHTAKSLTRESWSQEPHSKTQVARHGHYQIKPGETDWNMCGVTGNSVTSRIYSLGNPKLFADRMASRDRLVTCKQARFAAETSRLSPKRR